MQHPLTGILPVAPTPFHADGRIDEEGMRRVLDCLIENAQFWFIGADFTQFLD